MKQISLFLAFLIFAVLSWTGPPTACAYDPMCEYYEEHNGACCSDCHDMVSCATTNLFCVPSPISTPNSGEKPVVYDSINSQVRGTQPYDGVCEVCHTQTRFHRNNASGDHTHCVDKKCTSCHLHGPTTMVSKGLCYTCHGGSAGDVPSGNPPMFATKGAQSHVTHKNAARGPQFGDIGEAPGCTGCHQTAAGGGVFSDGEPLATTTVCDNCHSEGGAYKGVTMAKANWTMGIYEADGTTLKSGNENWCASCHDIEPANSKKDGSGVDAPNVIGDGTSYGYYASGHGANALVDCADCHDPAATHIDHEPRTYQFDENTGQAVNPYCDSYRLKEIDGEPSMIVPRAGGGALANWQDFALCFDCHNRYEVIGQSSFDVSYTNFWDNDSNPNNSHWYHLGTIRFDSDWDGNMTNESADSCVACHNVHGSPTGPMIRHGELISPPGTTNYVPAFNFFYLFPGDASATATFTPSPALAGGTYDVYAWWVVNPNRATNAKYIITYDGGSDSVIVNQEQNGGQWNLLGQYTFAAGSSGNVVLTSDGADEYIMADAVRWYRTDGGDEVIVDDDDPDTTYQGTWSSGSGGYNDTQRWFFAPIKDATASVTESVGAKMQSGNIGSSHICNT